MLEKYMKKLMILNYKIFIYDTHTPLHYSEVH